MVAGLASLVGILSVIFIAVPAYRCERQQGREACRKSYCRSGLMYEMNMYKESWAEAVGAEEGMPVFRDAVTIDGEDPKCPSGGRYEIGVVGENVRCSLHGTSSSFHGNFCKPDSEAHVAARKGNVQALETFLKHGFRVDQKTYDGWTPLHLAAFAGKLEMVKFLLGKGANIHAETVAGKTPLDLAADKEIIACLLRNGARTGIAPLPGQGEREHIGKILKLAITHEFIEPNNYYFRCRLTNDGDKSVRVIVCYVPHYLAPPVSDNLAQRG
jgi:hypothetical protein